MRTFCGLRVGEYFRVPGYDDLLKKVSRTHAKCIGHGWLKKPTRLCRKGEISEFDPTIMVS